MKSRVVSLIPAAVWFIIIFVLLTLPGKDLPEEDFLSVIYFDKWVHAGLFGGLVFLLSYPSYKRIHYKSSFYMSFLLFSVAYGVIMEFVQKYWTVDRDYDINDMLADSSGAVLGYLFFRFVAKRLEKNKPL